MPIYEYECEKCGHRFDKLVSRSDVKVKCEKCASARVKKLISTFSSGNSCSAPGGT